MTSANREEGVTKFWAILQMVVDGFWGGGIFLALFTSARTNKKSRFSVLY